jgi:hypothetical protein
LWARQTRASYHHSPASTILCRQEHGAAGLPIVGAFCGDEARGLGQVLPVRQRRLSAPNGTTVVVTRSFLDKKPDAVARFVKASLQGWRDDMKISPLSGRWSLYRQQFRGIAKSLKISEFGGAAKNLLVAKHERRNVMRQLASFGAPAALPSAARGARPRSGLALRYQSAQADAHINDDTVRRGSPSASQDFEQSQGEG